MEISKSLENSPRRGISKALVQRSIIFGILLLVIVVSSFVSSSFLTLTNLSNVTRQVAMIIITGCAATLLMISGNIDLSAGSVVALTGVLCAKFAVMGFPLPTAILLASICGGLMGLVNGVLVTRLRMSPVIATLGTMYMGRGLALIFADGKTINVGLPENFILLGRSSLGPIPVPLLITIVVVALFIFIQNKTLLGRYSYAIGGNRVTAVLSGVNVSRIVLLLYVLTGVFAGFSGTILAARLGVGHPNVGVGFEFDVIIAIIIGGTSLTGGEGTVIGMVIGAFIVGFLSNVLNLLGMQAFYQDVVKGLVLVFAVLMDIVIRDRIK